ncbi:MAG: zf-HC2 domain-containing protein [Chloroflexota bacterium]
MDAANHPVDEILIAHAAGELSPSAALPVIAHLAACPECVGTVRRYAVVRSAVREDDSVEAPAAVIAGVHALFAATRPTLRSRAADAAAPVRRMVADLVFDSWGRLAPGFAAVRGAADGRQLSWSAAEPALDADVQVLAAEPGAAVLRLVGQVATGAGDGAAREVALVRDGERVAAAEPDGFGAFSLAAPAGRYELEVNLDGTLVVLPGVELG